MKKYLYITFLAVTALMYCSCSEAGINPDNPEKAAVEITVSSGTRAVMSKNDGTAPLIDNHEGIKTLRIIVLDENWKIIENWYREGIGDNDGKTEEQTISLLLPRQKVRFLAIANEMSMGRRFDTASLTGDSDYETGGIKGILDGEWVWPGNSSPFPKTDGDIAEYGLPMTGIKGAGDAGTYNDAYGDQSSGPVDLSEVTDISIEIPLVRCVSKIVVNVRNLMDRDLNINAVNFGKFFADKVFCFAPGGDGDQQDMPEDATVSYWPANISEVQLEKSETYTTILTGYFYPVALSQNADFTIALESNVATDTPQSFLSDGTIPRNSMLEVNCTVNLHGELIVEYKVLPWNTVNTSIGYAPQHIPTDSNPFKEGEEWEESYIANGDYYALFPIESYNSSRNTTTKLLHYLYDKPEGGDNEARLCILTRPTYDDNEHRALKAGSAGARYLFIFTGPEGATWEAHLTNEEDFSFSTTKENDFENSEYESEGEVYKATHGIARKKPYIIQIIADHLYTGYDTGLSGSTEDESDYNGDGYDNVGKDKDDWEKYFGDNYLTKWGQEKWEKKQVVETEFYITVRLTDGTEYELSINPSYSESNISSDYFPFKEKRRYAGTDYRIVIRHIRAKYGIENLEDIAENDPSVWWKKNPYWNPDHTW